MRMFGLERRSRLESLTARVVLTTCVLLGMVGNLIAADADLDPLWNSDGMLSLGAADTIFEARGIAVQCDGKVVVVGVTQEDGAVPEGLVIRFTEFGYLDTTFATNGVFYIAEGPEGNEAWDVVAQPDGKTVVVGTRLYAFGGPSALALRLTEDGVPDPAFGSGGYREFSFSDLPLASVPHAVALQDDGRVVVTGTTSDQTAVGVARLTSAGSLDTSFDGDGKTTVDLMEGDDEGWDVALLHDGRIVVAGTAVVGGGAKFAVLSFLPSGAPDTRFGPAGDGQNIFDFGDASYGRGVAVSGDGGIVVAGSTDASSLAMALAKLTEDGELDPLFSGDGKVIRDFGPGLDEGWDVAMQGDGRIIVAGNIAIDGLDHFVLARFTPEGLEDTSFGGFGYTAVNLGADSFGRGVAVQPHDRKILLAGFVDTPPVDEARLGAIRAIGDGGIVFADGFECGDASSW